MAFLYNIEHYMVCGLPVTAVRAPDVHGRVIQAWAADKATGTMRRDATLMDDIETDSRVRPLSKMAFDAYCAQHNINTNIPERAIQQTLSLVSDAHKLSRDSNADKMNGFGYGAFAFV